MEGKVKVKALKPFYHNSRAVRIDDVIEVDSTDAFKLVKYSIVKEEKIKRKTKELKTKIKTKDVSSD